MNARFFTLEEANALLPEIKPLMAQLLERRARVVHASRQISEILKSDGSNVGGAEASRLVQDFIVIERLAEKIRAQGCIIKDLNSGLVDFLSKRDGREVYLCWRYGEPKIEYYHDLHTGFAGREHV